MKDFKVKPQSAIQDTLRRQKALDGATVYGNKAAASSLHFIFTNSFIGKTTDGAFNQQSANNNNIGIHTKTIGLLTTPATTGGVGLNYQTTTTNKHIKIRNSGKIIEK